MRINNIRPSSKSDERIALIISQRFGVVKRDGFPVYRRCNLLPLPVVALFPALGTLRVIVLKVCLLLESLLDLTVSNLE